MSSVWIAFAARSQPVFVNFRTCRAQVGAYGFTMQTSSLSTFQPGQSATQLVPYSSAALRQDLQRVRGVWDDCQANRDRNAIYGYLGAVYGLVVWWAQLRSVGVRTPCLCCISQADGHKRSRKVHASACCSHRTAGGHA
jgi:hypothetical protein